MASNKLKVNLVGTENILQEQAIFSKFFDIFLKEKPESIKKPELLDNQKSYEN